MTQQRQLLEPFSEKVIKKVNKGFGDIDYVSWTDKIQRLIMVLGGFDWTVEVIPGTWHMEERLNREGKAYEMKVADSGAGDGAEPIAVVGSLTVTIDGTARVVQGIGTGRDAKTAETDAFSRCCAKIGLGLHLWTAGGAKDGGYWITGVIDREVADEH